MAKGKQHTVTIGESDDSVFTATCTTIDQFGDLASRSLEGLAGRISQRMASLGNEQEIELKSADDIKVKYVAPATAEDD